MYLERDSDGFVLMLGGEPKEAFCPNMKPPPSEDVITPAAPEGGADPLLPNMLPEAC